MFKKPDPAELHIDALQHPISIASNELIKELVKSLAESAVEKNIPHGCSISNSELAKIIKDYQGCRHPLIPPIIINSALLKIIEEEFIDRNSRNHISCSGSPITRA